VCLFLLGAAFLAAFLADVLLASLVAFLFSKGFVVGALLIWASSFLFVVFSFKGFHLCHRDHWEISSEGLGFFGAIMLHVHVLVRLCAFVSEGGRT
jgi:hypothetical protein